MDIGFVSHSYIARAFAGSFFSAVLPRTARVHSKPGKFGGAPGAEGAGQNRQPPWPATSARERPGVETAREAVMAPLFRVSFSTSAMVGGGGQVVAVSPN